MIKVRQGGDMNPNTIKIGDTVMARHCFGEAPAALALVTGLTITEYPRDKWGGDDVNSVPFKTVRENRCIFTLRYLTLATCQRNPAYPHETWHYADQIDI